MKKITIAIDGYSACGKSSTAKVVARELGYKYIDSGAMYRAVTLYFLDEHVTLTNEREVHRALDHIKIDFHLNDKNTRNETYLNGLNVEEQIRTMRVSQMVSEVSAIPAVREAMVAQQQKMGKKGGVVMDGRDIGTVVFPDADLKVFMSADLDVRSERRQQELFERNQMEDLETIKKNLLKRDHIDTTREVGPLRKAEDAHPIDTTHITFDEQVEEILSLAMKRMLLPASEEKNA